MKKIGFLALLVLLVGCDLNQPDNVLEKISYTLSPQLGLIGIYDTTVDNNCRIYEDAEHKKLLYKGKSRKFHIQKWNGKPLYMVLKEGGNEYILKPDIIIKETCPIESANYKYNDEDGTMDFTITLKNSNIVYSSVCVVIDYNKKEFSGKKNVIHCTAPYFSECYFYVRGIDSSKKIGYKQFYSKTELMSKYYQ